MNVKKTPLTQTVPATKKTNRKEMFFIKPLFLMVDDSKNIGNHIISFAKDDYNKAIGESLIDAKNDAQAVSSFLLEFRNEPLTLISYSKEIERLLLWCIHIAKLNISSLRRDHLMAYQDFLKNPEPKNTWIGAKVTRQLKNGSANPNWRLNTQQN